MAAACRVPAPAAGGLPQCAWARQGLARRARRCMPASAAAAAKGRPAVGLGFGGCGACGGWSGCRGCVPSWSGRGLLCWGCRPWRPSLCSLCRAVAGSWQEGRPGASTGVILFRRQPDPHPPPPDVLPASKSRPASTGGLRSPGLGGSPSRLADAFLRLKLDMAACSTKSWQNARTGRQETCLRSRP